jgi:ubiquinone/menaquinone biosynthesis C-methylase UbiE
MLDKKIIDSIFWNSYATAYDDIARYYRPYKTLMEFIIAFIEKKLKKGRILDAGCGTGELSAQLSLKGYKIDALDISKVMLEVFKKKILNRKLTDISIKHGDLNKKLPHRSASFNSVINVHSLFMLDNINSALNEFARVLKIGGYLIIAHHKPIKLSKVIDAVLKEEGFIRGFATLLRLLRVGFFNVFLGQIHRKIYGDMSVKNIVKYMKGKKIKLIYRNMLYNGFDELLIFKK